jgi:hypothetical protein
LDAERKLSSNPICLFKRESASHPLSSENEMDDAIREAVDEVILELNSWNVNFSPAASMAARCRNEAD